MKIFVAKLAYNTKADDIRTLFEQYGIVTESKVIFDHTTGHSKGYGFVEMPNDQEAYQAIVETDDTIFMGKEIQVKKSRPQTETLSKTTRKNRYFNKSHAQKPQA